MHLIRLLGGASIEGSRGATTGRATQRARIALLAILAASRNNAASRDRLAALLWPETDSERARHLLRESLYRLRETLGEGALPSVGSEVRLDREQVRCDLWEFEDAIVREEWESADQLYSGQLLEGFFLEDSPEFDQWMETERNRLAALHARVLESLAAVRTAAGDLPGAATIWRRRAATDQYNSRIAISLMMALDAAGDRAAALKHASFHNSILEADLGAVPDPSVSALAERLRQQPKGLELPELQSKPEPDLRFARDSSAERPALRSRRLQVWPHGAYAAAILIALVSIGGLAFKRRNALPLDPDRIAVLPFRTSGADSTLTFLRDGLTELLSLQLNGEVGPTAVDAGETLREWRNRGSTAEPLSLGDAIAAARELGAGQLAYGAVIGTAKHFTVVVSTVDVSRGTARHAPVQVEGTVDSLPAVVAALSARILGTTVGSWRLSNSEVANAETGVVRAYLAGMVHYRNARWVEAGRQLFNAITRDSTFLPAAYRFALVHAILAPTTPLGEAPRRDPRMSKLYRILWANRKRLPEDQRVLVEAVTDSIYVLWHHQSLPRLEKAVVLLPGSPEAWELLGQAYYHAGALVGRDDWSVQAHNAFVRALELDPTIAANARRRLADIAFIERDARMHSRYATAVSGPRGKTYLRYQAALLRGEHEAIRRARSDYSRSWSRGEEEGASWALTGLTLPQRELDSLLTQMQSDARTDQQRESLIEWMMDASAMGGRPGRVASLNRQFISDTIRFYSTLVDYAVDDSVAAERLAPLARPPKPARGVPQPPIGCNAALSRLRRSDTTGVVAILATEPRLDESSDVTTALSRIRRGPVAQAAVCGQVLRGVLASLHPAGMSQLMRADSVMRQIPLNYADFWNYDVAVALGRRGQYSLAAAAARRHFVDLLPLPRLVIALRNEGRWDALAGDTAEAVKAYEHYLMWREDPEPALIPQRDSVRAELAALEGWRRRQKSPFKMIKRWFLTTDR